MLNSSTTCVCPSPHPPPLSVTPPSFKTSNRITNLTLDICLRSFSISLPPCELSSIPLAFSIRQSAGRPAGGRVRAVCKEVQHQAFCLTRSRVVGQTNIQPHRKQGPAEERKGGFMRGIRDLCTLKYIKHSRHKTISLSTSTPFLFVLSSWTYLQRSAQV